MNKFIFGAIEAEKKIAELSDRLTKVSVSGDRYYNKQWLDYLYVRNGLVTASAILRSARLRRESRGVHIREDYFYTDNNQFLNNIIIENTELNHRMDKPIITKVKLEDSNKHGYVEYIEETIKKLS